MVDLTKKKVLVPINIKKELSDGRSILVPNPEYLQLQNEYQNLVKDVPQENEEEFIDFKIYCENKLK